MNAVPTKAEILAAVEVARSVADLIRELGEVPSGLLYARLMSFMDLAAFHQVVALLVDAGLVERRSNNILRWVA